VVVDWGRFGGIGPGESRWPCRIGANDAEDKRTDETVDDSQWMISDGQEGDGVDEMGFVQERIKTLRIFAAIRGEMILPILVCFND